MRKFLLATSLCFAFYSTGWSKTPDATNYLTKKIEMNALDQMYYQCRITVTNYNSEGEVTSQTVYTYTLSGSKSACQTWCDNKAEQFGG